MRCMHFESIFDSVNDIYATQSAPSRIDQSAVLKTLETDCSRKTPAIGRRPRPGWSHAIDCCNWWPLLWRWLGIASRVGTRLGMSRFVRFLHRADAVVGGVCRPGTGSVVWLVQLSPARTPH